MTTAKPTALRWRVFALTWLAYATYYLTRKSFSVDKTTLNEQLGLSLGQLSAIDTGYLAAYAIGQVLSGIVADRVGEKRLLLVGMTLVATSAIAFGASSTVVAFGLLFTIHGFAQSTGWPGTVRAMTPWFSPQERGRIMGPWTTCYQIGGLAATAMASWILVRYGWRATFFIPAVATLVVGALLLFLPPPPARPPESVAPTVTIPTQGSIYRQPLAWSLGATYFVCKLVRYAFLFWLPYYFGTRFHVAKDHAGYYSLAFEVGGILGSLAAGTISDRMKRRGLIAVVMLLGLSGSLYFAAEARSLIEFVVVVGACGFFLFGPDALVSAIAAQDLGGVDGVGRASGFINGVGSVGGLCQGFVTVVLVEAYGWRTLFFGFVVATLLAAVTCVPYALKKRIS